ncbi:arylalkylamine N-acetyltransferase 1 isoform X1 [Calliopsis andreniformis]|uniref:arylalkylamine N-acetyltransferase 1 isoform X1 n=1 Tax=Calliopsis andreniformis TaxID=337506 RepID=UPI003FCDB4C7
MELNNELYTIEWAKQSHLSDLLSFFYENFDKEETMLKNLKSNCNSLTEEEEKLMRLDHERLIRAIFTFSPCLIILENSSNKIIGANLMIVSKNPKFNTSDGVSAVFSNNPPRTKLMKQYFNYLSEISEKAHLFEKFPEAKAAVEFYAVAVDKNYRKIGLAKKLMAEGISFAQNVLRDIGFIFGVYTSMYSKMAAEKLGLKSIMDVDLLTYKDAEGRTIFENTPPHNIISVMVLDL